MLERIAAYWQSQLVFVAAKLGIADVLVEGPLTADEIADLYERVPVGTKVIVQQ